MRDLNRVVKDVKNFLSGSTGSNNVKESDNHSSIRKAFVLQKLHTCTEHSRNYTSNNENSNVLIKSYILHTIFKLKIIWHALSKF